jgi:limonene-1,2-epoxide hydrolase
MDNIGDLSKGNHSESEFALTIDKIKKQWSKTYNSEGKPDWSHIFPFYDENIIFEDTIQKIEGKDEFKKMCERLAKRCEKLQMDIYSIAQDNRDIFMQWKMTMVFRKLPNAPIFGCTKIKLNDNGKIIEQRDYFDLWGDIFDRVKGFRILYRKFMKKFFG